MQRYNVTLDDDEYKNFKKISVNFGISMSKIIKRLIRIMVKSGVPKSKDTVYVMFITDKGAWAIDLRSGEDIHNLRGGTFEVRPSRKKGTIGTYNCDISVLSEKRIYRE